MRNIFIASVVAITVAASSGRAQTVTVAQWTIETAGATNGMTLAPGAGGNPGNISADNGLNSGATSPATGLHAGAATYSIPAGDLDPAIAALAAGSSGPGLPGSSLANSSPSLHAFSANGWAVGDYWQFTTSTLGFTGVNVAWDQAGSSTGPSSFSLQYSVNGGAFTSLLGPYTVALSAWNTTTAAALSTNVAGGGVLDGATTLTLRLVDQSTVSIGGGTVAAGGTDRVDNFTVTGIPEPSTVTLVGAGLVGLLALRRRRS